MSRIKIQITTPSNNVIKVSPGVSALSSVQLYLNDLVNVDTSSGQDGYVLTQQADGSFAMEAVATTLSDLTDVIIIGALETGDVLVYDSPNTRWVKSSSLQSLIEKFKGSSAGAQVFDTLLDTTKGYLDVQSTTAALKVNKTGFSLSESSPGTIDFQVATDAGGTTQFTAASIEGQPTQDVAIFNVSNGTYLHINGASGYARINPPSGGNIALTLPNATGTLALTTDIPSVVGLISGGTTGQALVKSSGADYDVEWADIAIETQYHQRYSTEAETLRSGATDTLELYFFAQADGNGLAESASSDTPTAGYDIRRKLWYSEKAQADPDTSADWTQFTAIADNTAFTNSKTALLEYLKDRTGGTVPISLKMTWEEIAQAPAFTGLLNESYGSGAEAAYSTRRLNGSYSGDCMTIRRASDGTTQSIGFVGEEIDESAITTFCTGTTCTVQVWRDQSGNGNDATAPSTTNEPTIYTGGQLMKEGGRLSLDFDGSNDYLDSVGLTETTLTSFHIAKPAQTNSGDALLCFDGNTGNGFFRYNSNGTMRVNFFGGINTATNYTASQNLVFALYGTSVAVGYNGATAETGSATGITTTGVRIGQKGNVDYFNGQAQEVVIYPSDKSTDRTSIEGNISEYFQSAKLLDEQFGEGAEAAYSTRQLRRDQTDCMVIRRTSDSTTTTIGFDTEGNIDEAAITTFCTGTTCTVSEWKDQSGNGNDATAPSTGAEPIIYTGGTINEAVYFATGDVLALSTGASITSSFVVARVPNIIIGAHTAASGSNPRWWWGGASLGGIGYKGDGGAIQSGVEDSFRRLQSVFVGDSTDRQLIDGTQKNTDNNQGVQVLTHLGATAANTSNLQGYIYEFIGYNADKYSVRADIQGNIGNGITKNTPLLDTYSGAAAAYSLRLLDSTYTGDAVEVYNGSSYADIGFNVFGELDTVALAAHCGSSDGFVSKWYDQSGNTNTAAQAATASMPKIYDGTTGVVTENGKPAVELDGTGDGFDISPAIAVASQKYIFTVHSIDSSDGQWTIFSETVSTDLVPIAQSGSSGAIVFGYTLNALYKDGGTAFSGTRNDLYNAYTSAGQSLTTIDFSGDGVGNLFRRSSFETNGTAQEIVIYASDQSSNRTNIETNINTFYNIYS